MEFLDLTEIFFGFFVLLLTVIPYIVSITLVIYLIKRKVKSFHEVRKEEFWESVQGGSIKEPHTLRDLTDEERKLLTEKSERLQKTINRPLKICLGVALIFILVAAVFLTTWQEIIREFDLIIPLKIRFWTSSIFSLVITYWLINYSYKSEEAFYKDLQLPVMQVVGKFLPIPGITTKKYYFFRVRGNSFSVPRDQGDSGQFNKRLRKILLSIKETKEIKVEFSPCSKQVWEIKKV